MTPKTEIGSFAPDATTSSPSGSKRQFDTFETDFFQQGDAEGAGAGVGVERFDDLDDSSLRKKLTPSRQFMMGVAVGSTCIAIIGCLALWRSSGAKSHPAAAIAEVLPAQAEPSHRREPGPRSGARASGACGRRCARASGADTRQSSGRRSTRAS